MSAPKPNGPARPGPEREGGRPGARHRRRRRGKDRQPPAPAPAKVVAQAATAAPALAQDKPIEEPLSERELAVMKQHLRFLRDHRRVLNLKVNAQEDLLLNEARVPTRRGVCQHLLGKVDRARVFGAAQRLEPAAATRLAEGVLRISPDIDYLLLYLDCVRRSASQQQAVSALGEALERIDFSQVSPAQLRRVLDLIVELFEQRQRVPVLLGLLAGSAFRDAVDHSATGLPPELAQLVLPLRAVQAAILQGKRGQFAAAALQRGVELLLDADQRTLLAYSPAARRRLLEYALEAPLALLTLPGVATSLRVVLDSLEQDARAHGELGLALARVLVRAGVEREARALLQSLLSRYPDLRQPRHWLDALAAPRLGRVALIESRRRDPRPPEAGVKEGMLDGVALDSMQRVTVFVADSPDDPSHRAHLALLQGLPVSGVAPLWQEGSSEVGRPWFAVPRFGRRLSAALSGRHGLEREQVLQLCAEAALLLSTLAELGIVLPDADARRFELADNGRLWLVDLRGGERIAPDEARRTQTPGAVGLCERILGPLGSAELRSSLRETGQTTELVRRLAQYLA
jgi:hypothetical protein